MALTPLAYSVRDIAELVRVSDRTVWRWIKAGELRSVKVGGSVRVPAAEVEKLFQGAKVEAKPKENPKVAARIRAMQRKMAV